MSKWMLAWHGEKVNKEKIKQWILGTIEGDGSPSGYLKTDILSALGTPPIDEREETVST